MSMETKIVDLATRIGTEFKAIRTLVGGTGTSDVSGLLTTATDLVAAINEVRTSAGAAAVINDAATSGTQVWSSTKTNSEIAVAVSAIVASSPAALDTLNELAAALGNDANYAASVAAALGERLRLDAAGSYSPAQIAQGQANLEVYSKDDIGLTAITHDFVADFNAAIA